MHSRIFSDGRITLALDEKNSNLEVLSTQRNKRQYIPFKDCLTPIEPEDIIKCRDKNGNFSKTEKILKLLEEKGFKEVR